MKSLAPEILELRALEKAATPAPWRAGSVETYNVFCEGGSLTTERVLLRMNANEPFRDQYPIDARLLAAARNALPSLLDRVETMEKLLATCGYKLQYMVRAFPGDKQSRELLDAIAALLAPTPKEKSRV